MDFFVARHSASYHGSGRSLPASEGVERCLRVKDGADHFVEAV